MAKWQEIFNSRYCSLPICNCGLEKQIKKEHKLFHFLDKTKYYAGRCDRQNLVCPDEPLNIWEEKRKHQLKLDPEECRAYMPLMYDKVSPCEIFEENDIRIEDSVRRTAEPSTLTNMLPLKALPVKKKDSDWGSYQDMSRDYSTDPHGPETYISMMTRFTHEMIVAKIPDFRTAASTESMK